MKQYIFFIFWIASFSSVYAQEREVISTAGGDETVEELNMTFTIGEPVVELATGDSLYLTAGFQQSNILVSIPLSVDEIHISAKVFPNPAKDYFYLDIDNQDTQGFMAALHNTKGDFIRIDCVNAAPLKVSLSGLPSGVYYLTVLSQENKKMHQFKILKTE